MKQLRLETAHYRYLEAGFKEWLDIQGYAESTVNSLPIHIHELLHWQEKQGYTEIGVLNNQQINILLPVPKKAQTPTKGRSFE